MAELIDLTGQTFGRLTVVARGKAKDYAPTAAYWDCKCECGNTTAVQGGNLRNGNTRSCGCLKSEVHSERCRTDITGQRFGKLLVMGFHSTTGSGAMWECVCDCGNTKVVRGTALRSGHTTSCGCNRKGHGGGYGPGMTKDITNQKFGSLTAVKRDGRESGKMYWLCKCDCGNEKRVRGTDLSHGNTKSCGCGQKSGLLNQPQPT